MSVSVSVSVSPTSQVIHWSAANTSDAARHAYTIHVVDGAPGVEYPVDNWLQRADGSKFNAITNFLG